MLIHHQIYKNFMRLIVYLIPTKICTLATGKNIPIFGTTHSDYSYDEIINLKY